MNSSSDSSGAGAAAGAKVGSKTGRIIRVIWLIRLIRIVKLYKHAHNAMEKKEEDDEEEDIDFTGNNQVVQEEEAKSPEESKVGKKLSDLTTRRVIVLILTMMFSVPILTLTTYMSENESFTFGLTLVTSFPQYSNGYNLTKASYIEEHTKSSFKTPLVWMLTYTDWWEKKNFDNSTMRVEEYELV